MKIGDRVRLSRESGIHSGLRKKHGLIIGTIIRIAGDQAVVKWNHGGTGRTHFHCLIEEEPFPFHSHRTMAEVIADEQRPEPA